MKQKVIRLTENDLHNIIKESVNMILKENFKQDEIDASWDAWENTRQPKSHYGINGNLDTYLDDDYSWYDLGKEMHDDIIDDGEYDDKIDDFLSDYHEFSKNDDGFNSMQAQRTDYPDFYKRNYQDKYSNNPKKLEQFK